MSDPHVVWDELHALLARLEDQKKQIYVHYQDLVGAVLTNQIVSEREIEAIMDGLLDFAMMKSFSVCTRSCVVTSIINIRNWLENT